ncbi:MAG: protein kinase domain-containing protein [Pirellula sp.]
MQSRPPTASTELVDDPKPGHIYHCVCGYAFPVDFHMGGQCPSCQRRVSGEAIQNAIHATVSIADIKDEKRIHHFEIEPDDGLTNQVFGHFRLERRLGGGGMGAVYRALDMSLQRYVAVKVMQNRNLCGDSRLKAILREAVAQGRLNHPNVVTIYYVGRQEDEPFLAMELLPGPTLAERLKTEGTLPYAEAIRYGIQVASALKHAALFDIVHADIKPANLIMAGDGRIKLSDFGLSRNRTDADADAPIAGTPSYVAPELISGAGFSIQSDMYALGVTLFELVFGRTPFELKGNTIRERVSTHLHAAIDFPTPWPNHIPREFKGLIERLLAKTPDARFADYDELLAELQSIAPVSTTPAGFAPRAMAYVVDQLLLLLAIAPFAVLIFALSGGSAVRTVNLQWLIPIIAFASLIVPALYLLTIYRGWPSFGRYLFQLRIVEEHGLPPRREQLVPREVLRNAFAWCFPLALYVSLQSEGLSQIIEFALIGFMAMNTITLFLLRGRKAMHDFLCHSQVVLEVNKP